MIHLNVHCSAFVNEGFHPSSCCPVAELLSPAGIPHSLKKSGLKRIILYHLPIWLCHNHCLHSSLMIEPFGSLETCLSLSLSLSQFLMHSGTYLQYFCNENLFNMNTFLKYFLKVHIQQVPLSLTKNSKKLKKALFSFTKTILVYLGYLWQSFSNSITSL